MKKLITSLLSAAFIVSALPQIPAASADNGLADSGISYTESVETIQNPGAGYTSTVWAVCKPGKTPVYSPTGSLVLFFIDIGAFSSGVNGTTDADGNYVPGKDYDLDQTFFDSWRQTFDNCRKNGCMIAVRFRYDAVGKENPEPASFDKVLAHIKQIKDSKILSDNEDILAYVESGFVGKWGEQHGGKYTTVDYKTRLLSAMLNAVPEPIPVTVRTPDTFANLIGLSRADLADDKYYKRYSFSDPDVVVDPFPCILDFERVGLYDDGYMGSDSDLGTYADREIETEWLSRVTHNTYFGGEFSGDIDYAKQFNTYLPENAIPEMYKTRLSYINGNIFQLYKDYTFGEEYSVEGIDNSAYYGQSVFQFIRDHIGYRFVVRKAENTAQTAQGGDVRMKFDLENTGFGEVVFPTRQKVMLEKDGVIYSTNVSFNGGAEWDTVRNISNDLSIKLPDSIAPGEWNIYLRITPAVSNIGHTPKYGIRFANDGIWNAQLGANYMGKVNITKSDTVGTDNYMVQNGAIVGLVQYSAPVTYDDITVVDGEMSNPREWKEADIIKSAEEQSMSLRADEEAIYVMGKMSNAASAPVYNLEVHSGGERYWLYYASDGYIYFDHDSYAGCQCKWKNGMVEFKIPFEVMGLTPGTPVDSIRLFLQDSANDWKELGDLTAKNVDIPSKITVYTAEHDIRINTDKAFTLFAETANEDLSCQWYHNGKAIEGATKMTYTIPKPSASDEGSYSVKLTNVSGIETTTNIVNIVKVVGAVPEVPPQGSDVPGDTNCDGTVELSDAILIMQALANPNKYGIEGSDPNHLTEQGRINGDVEGGKNGLTSNDALEIQRKLLGLITDFAK
ncbi:MAG: DUF4832 domain-containing protein [Ruminococcus sp.]|uniref:DUF4832 domain-containing protein n=1 Tax=Ruminococcus sp. TaxID=41978 RepID=UPI0025E96AB0|nr:DUF4832 domain-containing protein [Ruminococcus sp.]MBR6996413.1 DUF4832 domain-containing protein [Ruminococcus sp.]